MSDSRLPHSNRSAWMRRVGTPSAGRIVTTGWLYMIGLDPLTLNVLFGSTLFNKVDPAPPHARADGPQPASRCLGGDWLRSRGPSSAEVKRPAHTGIPPNAPVTMPMPHVHGTFACL